jgi:ubiquinone biosynthesis protein COQ9
VKLDPHRAKVLDALISHVAFEGWTERALRHALVAIGEPPEDAPLLFPDGPGEMIEGFFTLANERMTQAAGEAGLAGIGRTARVRTLIALWLAQHRNEKEAIRRALAWLALPLQARRAARILAASVNAIWHAAGDSSADFSWYTKRAILAGIYTSTLLYWLRDPSEEDEATLAFLDRRLAAIGSLGRMRARVARFRGPRPVHSRS